MKLERKLVRVNKPGLREHGVRGVVKFYDHSTKYYTVELESGPPWRGLYKSDELEPVSSEVNDET